MLQRLRQNYRSHNYKVGFTLIELAIVLAVAALLFAGLWRLMAGGSAQLRDQSAADQQKQLISAVKGYLNSNDGKTIMLALNSNNSFELSLPTSNNDRANCLANSVATLAPIAGYTGSPAGSLAAVSNFSTLCDYLPAGFFSGTTNSYGQQYKIRVLKDNEPQNSPPKSYSFMIMTDNNGDDIPDTSGGRISSLIGNDGGFIYNTDVCTGAGTNLTGTAARDGACGAYGAWATAVGTYGFGGGTSGRVATRTMMGIGEGVVDPWLARNCCSAGAASEFNTMHTDMFFDNGVGMNPRLIMNGKDFRLGQGGGVAGSGGNMYVDGGAINLNGGQIVGSGSTADSPTVDAISGVRSILVSMGGSGIVIPDDDTYTPALTVSGANSNVVGATVGQPCIRNTPSNGDVGANKCPFALQVVGNQGVSGMLLANNLQAGSFIYTSDFKLKHDIKPLEDPLDKLSKVRAVSYIVTSSGEKRLGVVAQEVEKVYPELVQGAGTDQPKGVDYVGLIGPLVGAVNELREQNDQLRKQIKMQNTEITKLKKQVLSDN